SSRRRHTRWPRDWSSDVCSSDLMSRIGNKAVEIPDKVKVNVGDGGQVSVEGPKGKLQWTLPREIRASVQDNRVSVVREAETRSRSEERRVGKEESRRRGRGTSTD